MTIGGRATYLNQMVNTAGPARLLLMLCDRLQLDVQRAIEAGRVGDHAEAGKQLIHAQEIVLELKYSLDGDVWEGASGLNALYDWIHRQLVQANVKRDVKPSREALSVIEPLVQTWHQAALAVPAPA